MDQIIEQWRAVPQWEGFYEVSDQGRVRSLDRVTLQSNDIQRRYRGQVLKPTPMNTGYPAVTLYSRQAGRLTRTVHSLVLEAFVGAPPLGMECAHGNGIKTDNRLENLRYATSKDNHFDKIKHGTHLIAESHGRAKLTNEQALEIYHSKQSYREIAEQYGIAKSTVRNLKAGRIWGSITSSTNGPPSTRLSCRFLSQNKHSIQ